MSHKYDILVMGASGFTGQLVAKYLASQAPLQNFTWAAGGRNREKIEQKMREVHAEPSEILVADSNDEAALRAAVKQVKVVISLIGPYLLHGEKLVKVCAEEGTHYVDLTGETPFIYKTVKQFQRSALDSKALIVHTSGFDSIPSDLGAFLAVQRLKQAGGDETFAGHVRTAFKAKGGMSGGTLSSLLTVVEEPKESREVASKVYALSPVEGKHKGRPVVVSSQTFKGQKTWGGFFLMAPINIPIVNRSWGILESADPSSRVLRYGPNFVYDEFMAMPGPISSFVASTVMLLSFGAIGESHKITSVHAISPCLLTLARGPTGCSYVLSRPLAAASFRPSGGRRTEREGARERLVRSDDRRQVGRRQARESSRAEGQGRPGEPGGLLSGLGRGQKAPPASTREFFTGKVHQTDHCAHSST